MGSTMEYSTPSYMVILLASICAAGPSLATHQGRMKLRPR